MSWRRRRRGQRGESVRRVFWVFFPSSHARPRVCYGMVSLVLGIYGLGRFTFERLHRYELILKVIMKHTSFDIGIDSNKFLYLLMKLHIISLLNLGMQSLRPVCDQWDLPWTSLYNHARNIGVIPNFRCIWGIWLSFGSYTITLPLARHSIRSGLACYVSIHGWSWINNTRDTTVCAIFLNGKVASVY
jgi:hypothetical protein